jgi:hypothetical protein
MRLPIIFIASVTLPLLAVTVAAAQPVRTEPAAPAASTARMSSSELAEVKSLMRAELDQRMSILGKLRDCVKAAPDKLQIKTCQEQEHEAMRRLVDAMRAGTYE